MLACDLETPVSLASVFEPGDLKDTGIEYDSHITLLYAGNKFIDHKTDLKWKLFDPIREYLQKQEENEDGPQVPVLEYFDLSNFENKSGYVILKMKENSDIYKILQDLNKGLSEEYGIVSEYGKYTPHLTLAELEPGLTSKYMESETLKLILQASTVHFEDLIISYSEEGKEGYDIHNLTTTFAVDRFFRIRELMREGNEIE